MLHCSAQKARPTVDYTGSLPKSAAPNMQAHVLGKGAATAAAGVRRLDHCLHMLYCRPLNADTACQCTCDCLRLQCCEPGGGRVRRLQRANCHPTLQVLQLAHQLLELFGGLLLLQILLQILPLLWQGGGLKIKPEACPVACRRHFCAQALRKPTDTKSVSVLVWCGQLVHTLLKSPIIMSW